MPLTCCVVQCTKRGNRDECSFYSIPSDKNLRGKFDPLKAERRARWLNAINRKDLKECMIKHSRVCQHHFISGHPAALNDVNNPDWVPSLHLGYKNGSPALKKSRYDRLNKRACNLVKEKILQKEEGTKKGTAVKAPTNVANEDIASQGTEVVNNVPSDEDLLSIIQNLTLQVTELKSEVGAYKLDENVFKHNDDKVLFFTGLKTYSLLRLVVDLAEPHIKRSPLSALTSFAQILLTLMKLRLNHSFTDLGYRFHINRRTASRYFYNCINILYYKLKRLVRWPTRDELRCNVPRNFKMSFGEKVAVIIDCFETFIERSSNPEALVQTWSNYKHHQTLKFLIGITPQGYISFISKAYGGRASDTFVTNDCGILNNLLPGDILLADRGFLIENQVKVCMAELVRPAFLKGKTQLHPKDVESTRTIGNVRIHVERVIGSIRQKYTMLHNVLPLTDVYDTENSDMCTIDKIVTICCALTNLCPSVVQID